MKSRLDLLHKGVKWTLFIALFIYLLLRVLYTDTLHDEIATYIFYFYHGDYIGENIQWDANNHLLNSIIGHQLYKVFGDNMAILRLPNLFAFVLYFFGINQLVKHFKTKGLKTTALIALTTIPFVIEYFGNARGYGLSFGFIVWAFYYLIQHFKAYNVVHLFYGYLFLILAVSSNLTLLISSLMIFVFCLLLPLIDNKFRPVGMRGREWLTHIFFGVVISPLILFGFALKKTGALYYGSLDGLWDVTGKTLSRYVLFFDEDWLRFIYLIIFGLMLFFVFRLLKSISFKEWVKEPIVFISTLFFGNLLGAVLLAEILSVNYPEDRAGMYLILYFLLIIFFLFERFRVGKWLQFTLLFFPISFAFHIDTETSVFSPDDRLNHDFYKTVKAEIKPEHSIMIYSIMNWNWPYAESHQEQKSSVAQFNNPNTTLTDIIVTKTTVLNNPDIIAQYDTIVHHPKSTYIAFKRKIPLLKIALDSSNSYSAKNNQEFNEIASFDSKEWIGKDIQISVKGHLKTTELQNKITLVVQGGNPDGTPGNYYYYSFETTYQSALIDDNFLHHFILENLTEKEIKIYLWNRAQQPLQLSDASCKIYELKAPENESR